MAIWYLNMINETKEFKKESRLYNESTTPQSEQKNTGWYWHSEKREFYRWDNQPPYSK